MCKHSQVWESMVCCVRGYRSGTMAKTTKCPSTSRPESQREDRRDLEYWVPWEAKHQWQWRKAAIQWRRKAHFEYQSRTKHHEETIGKTAIPETLEYYKPMMPNETRCCHRYMMNTGNALMLPLKSWGFDTMSMLSQKSRHVSEHHWLRRDDGIWAEWWRWCWAYQVLGSWAPWRWCKAFDHLIDPSIWDGIHDWIWRVNAKHVQYRVRLSPQIQHCTPIRALYIETLWEHQREASHCSIPISDCTQWCPLIPMVNTFEQMEVHVPEIVPRLRRWTSSRRSKARKSEQGVANVEREDNSIAKPHL